MDSRAGDFEGEESDGSNGSKASELKRIDNEMEKLAPSLANDIMNTNANNGTSKGWRSQIYQSSYKMIKFMKIPCICTKSNKCY